jgi:Uma2 family endonuclease
MGSAAAMLRIDGDRLAVPGSVFRLDDFRAWAKSSDFPAGIRATYVDSEVLIEMSPESTESHSKVKVELTASVERFVRTHDLGEVYPDRTLLSNESAGLSCEPDLMFISWETFEQGRAQLVKKADRDTDFVEIVGTPDLVVEIVSDSSVRKDLVTLRTGYLKAGVPEYWLIDARAAEIRFEIMRNEGAEYVSSDGPALPQRSLVLGARCTLGRRRNRLGRFTYDMDIRRGG